MKTDKKAIPIFWACIVVAIEALWFIGYIAIFIMGRTLFALLMALIPFFLGVYTIYFLIQRLRELDEEEAKWDKYDKY